MGLIIGAFDKVGMHALAEVYRSMFAFLAAGLLVGLVFYLRSPEQAKKIASRDRAPFPWLSRTAMQYTKLGATGPGRDLPAANVSRFVFLAVKPLFDLAPFQTCGMPSDDGRTVALWAKDANGLAMEAIAKLA